MAKNDINKTLNKISVKLHKKTGYSLHHSVLECRDHSDFDHDFFRFNSDEWQIFIEILNEAYNN